MKFVKFGLNKSDKGFEFFGSYELNKYLAKGWKVRKISPNSTFASNNIESHSDSSKALNFPGYDMIAELEHEELSKLFITAHSLSENLLRFDTQDAAPVRFKGQLKLRKAVKLYNKIIELDIENTEALLFKAKCHNALGEYHDGFKALQKAITLCPPHVILYCEIGTTLLKLEYFSKALTVMKQAVKHFPEEPRILEILGKSFLYNNHTEQANSVYEKLNKIKPTS